MEQELLFVGTENGKLVAMRDIIKKVRTLFKLAKNSICIYLFLSSSLLEGSVGKHSDD